MMEAKVNSDSIPLEGMLTRKKGFNQKIKCMYYLVMKEVQ